MLTILTLPLTIIVTLKLFIMLHCVCSVLISAIFNVTIAPPIAIWNACQWINKWCCLKHINMLFQMRLKHLALKLGLKCLIKMLLTVRGCLHDRLDLYVILLHFNVYNVLSVLQKYVIAFKRAVLCMVWNIIAWWLLLTNIQVDLINRF